MIEAAWLALTDIWTPPFRAVLWKSLALTLALLILIWFGLQALVVMVADWPSPGSRPRWRSSPASG